MGFWDVLGRIAQGKPAFEAPKPDDNWDDDSPTVDYAEEREEKRSQAHYAHDLYDDKGYKHPPVVEVIHVKPARSGDNLDLWVTIRNQSEREVHLGKMVILGNTFAFNYPLLASDQRVFHVYSGPALRHDHYHKAELYYRDEPTGDYFRADHAIEYHFEHDETYCVTNLQLMKPIKDV